MDMQPTIEKLIKDLERLFTEREEEKERLIKENEEYIYIFDLLEVIKRDKMSFISGVFSLDEEKRNEYDFIMQKVVPNLEDLNKINNEIGNLYQLQEIGLLDNPVVAPQKEYAFLVLDNLINYLNDYLSKIDHEYNLGRIEDIDVFLEKLILFGDNFENNTLVSPIDDIDYFEEILNEVNLDENDKMDIIQYILFENVNLYKEMIRVHQQKIMDEIEQSKKDALENALEEEIPISIEDYELLVELLEDEEIKRKIVQVVDENYSEETDLDNIDSSVLEESITLAKEAIIDIIYKEKVSPKAAIEIFIRKNNGKVDNAKKILSEILESREVEDLSLDEQASILLKAQELVSRYENKIKELACIPYEKTVLENYIASLYSNQNARITIYKSKYYNQDASRINLEAAYEINYFLKLLNYLDILEDKELRLKTFGRIREVLNNLDTVVNDLERDFIIEDEKSDRNLLFLMKNDEVTFLENDVQIERSNKGIGKQYYREIVDNLNELKQTNNLHTNLVRGTWKNLRRLGVQYKEGRSRTGLFYIPVDDENIIILGLDYKDGTNDHFVEMNNRVSLYQERIIELIEKIRSGQITLGELEQYKAKEEEIISKLIPQKESHNELIEMFLGNGEDNEDTIPWYASK